MSNKASHVSLEKVSYQSHRRIVQNQKFATMASHPLHTLNCCGCCCNCCHCHCCHDFIIFYSFLVAQLLSFLFTHRSLLCSSLFSQNVAARCGLMLLSKAQTTELHRQLRETRQQQIPQHPMGSSMRICRWALLLAG